MMLRAKVGWVAAAFVAQGAWAQLMVFADREGFLLATGAAPQPAWPNLGQLPGGAAATYTLGDVTLSVSPPSSGLWVGSGNHPLVGPDWTTLVEGNDLAVDGRENLNFDLARPVHALGFDFAEPTGVTVRYNPCSGLCPCANSLYTVTLRRAGETVAAFQFNRPDDVPSFVGVSSRQAFDRVEVRESTGTCDDEYFGRVYTRESCPVDFNGDGFLDFFDYDDYVRCFETGDCPAGRSADFNGDAFADFFDYDEFVAAFEQGC